MKKLLLPFNLNRGSVQANGLAFWGPGSGSGNLFNKAITGFSQASVGNGNIIGTIPSTGVWVAGKDGPGKTALLFDGSTNAVNLVNSQNANFGSAITVAAWIKTSKNGFGYVIVKWGTANGTDSFHFRVDGTTGFVYWNTSTTGLYQPGRDLNGTTNVCDGNWHHIAATYDGAVEKVYVDGQLQASLSVSGAIFADNVSLIRIGGLSDDNLTANWFQGVIDEPRIYTVALPGNVIAQMYNSATRWELRQRPSIAKVLAVYNKTPGPGFTTGPPMPGTPWFPRIRPSDVAHIDIAPPQPTPNAPVYIVNNTGPNVPGTPWFRLRPMPEILLANPPPNDFEIEQTVIIKSRFSANSGVLASGRRPERPGKS